MKKLNKKGFTLTELLVAVSIVAVLSAIAVPSYTKMRASARTTEAKTHLGQLHISQKSFFIQWGCYISDLKTIGFKPEGELLYNIGFSQETVTASECNNYNGPSITGTDNDLFTICGSTIGPPVTPPPTTLENCGFIYKGTSFTPPDIPTANNTLDVSIPAILFKAVAIADVHKPLSGDTTTADKNIWTIDNYRRIEQVQDIDGN